MLALVGSGEYLPDVDEMDRNLIDRLGEPAKVVCLPTAAGREGARSVNSWMERGVDHFRRLGVEATAVPVIDAASARDPAHAEMIQAANFVYLSGGHPGYLYETLAGTPVWAAIMDVHRRGGVVAGCSAGAMIMGERISGPGGNREGFNLLPGTVILPHFDEYPGIINRVLRIFTGRELTLVGIDGRTGLVVTASGYEVLGSGQVTLFRGRDRQTFPQGPLPESSFRPA
jgi:cyanophycinase